MLKISAQAKIYAEDLKKFYKNLPIDVIENVAQAYVENPKQFKKILEDIKKENEEKRLSLLKEKENGDKDTKLTETNENNSE